MASPREICRKSLAGLLKPVVRFAIRHSFRLRDIVEFLKIVYVDLAKEDLNKLGEAITASKISAMTGIQRPEVNRLLKTQQTLRKDLDIITRVIGLWQTSKLYRLKSGKVKVLSQIGRSSEFAKLVQMVSTDLNPYTVAFELERAGIAEQTKDGLKLIKQGYESLDDIKQGLALLAQDLDDIHSAVSENIFDTPAIRNLHIKTEFDNIPASKKDEIRNWFLVKGADLHEKARNYLSKLDRDINPKVKSEEPPIRAVIGTYSLTLGD